MSGTTQAMTLRICYAMPGIYPRLRNHQIPAEVMNKVARAEIGEVPESNRKNNSCLWNIALSATFGTDVVSSHQGGRARLMLLCVCYAKSRADVASAPVPFLCAATMQALRAVLSHYHQIFCAMQCRVLTKPDSRSKTTTKPWKATTSKTASSRSASK
eukprot:411814-Rhodomonas_salina.1